MKFQKNYVTYITKKLLNLSEGEIQIDLNDTPESDTGFLLLEKGIVGQEENIFYHRKEGNYVFCYGVNRTNPVEHQINSSVLLVNAVDAMNYILANIKEQFYIYKRSTTDIIITGGSAYENGTLFNISNVDTSEGNINQTLTIDSINYIYIEEGVIYITHINDNTKYIIAEVTVGLTGDILNISQVKPEVFKGLKGDKGDKGDTSTITIGTVTSGEYTSVTNVGTSTDAILDIVLEKGDTGSTVISGEFIGNDLVLTKDDETTVTIIDAKLNLKGDKGDKGDAATLNVGTTTAGIPGTNASVTNVGTVNDAIFNFVIPKGDKGEDSIVPGPTGNGIQSIILLSTVGKIKTYRVTYTDTTTFDFFTTDGEDGYTPVKGTDYFDGINGIDGKTITSVTSNKVGKTTTVTVDGDFTNAPYNFDIEDGVDGEGSGDVIGPASSVDNNIALFDGISGKLIKDGGNTIAQLKEGTILTDIDLDTITTGGRYGCIGTPTNGAIAGEFALDVTTDGTRIMQIATYLSGVVYTRYYAGSWSSWVKYSDDAKQNILSEGAFVDGDKTKLNALDSSLYAKLSGGNTFSGNQEVGGRVKANGDTYAIWSNQTGSDYGYYSSNTSAGNGWHFGSNSYGHFNFATEFGGGPSNKLTLLKNGNLGIGTTSPGAKLDVNGNVLQNGQTVGEPDFYKYNIVTSVTSGNLTVALKNFEGNDPTTTKPVKVMIGGVVRTITSALSKTVNAGTNWFNAGSSELQTQEIDFFAYFYWSVTYSVVGLSFARTPNGRVLNDFSTTSTNEKYLPHGALGTDYVTNIGRFNAILSATYQWSIPATSVIINRPVYETRLLSYEASLTWTASTAPTGGTNKRYKYQIIGDRCNFEGQAYNMIAGTSVTRVVATLPFQVFGGADYIPIIPSHLGVSTSTPNLSVGNMNFHGPDLYIHATSSNATMFLWNGTYNI